MAVKKNAHKYISNLVEKPEDDRSIVEKISELPKEERFAVLDKIVQAKYPDLGHKALRYDWEINGRPSQLIPLDLSNDWNIFALNIGRGGGKLSPLDTTVYTKSGWKQIGTLEVGDEVFDETGNWCTVLKLHEIYVPEKAYRFWFNDGSYIDSGHEHDWFTWTHQNRKQYIRDRAQKHVTPPVDWIGYCPNKEVLTKVLNECSTEDFDVPEIAKRLKVNARTIETILNGNYVYGTKKTTAEIVDTFYHGKRKDLNHCIINTLPLKFEAKDLPIPPFILGYWLGNGNSDGSKFTAHQDDIPEIMAKFESLGFKCIYEPEKDNQVFKVLKLNELLKKLNLINNKHTPNDYLTGSVAQRIELLKGFMTSDGGVDRESRVSYSSSRKWLADDVYWLVVSLGMKASRNERIPTYTYKGQKLKGKLSHRVSFTPVIDVFSLVRKSAMLNFDCGQMFKRYHRMIERYEEIEPVEMRCITVSSKNGAFLIGTQLVPTSNTRTSAEWVRHMANKFPGSRIALVGATASDVHKTMIGGDSGLLSITPDWEKIHHIPTYQRLEWENGSIAEYFALDISTKIPTPNGFKSMGELKVGDKLFDESGSVCNVIETTPVMLSNKCYEITFKNKQRIIADADHLWTVSTYNQRAMENKDGVCRSVTINSEEMAKVFRKPHKGRRDDYNLWIKRTAPVQYRKEDLPIPPYVLGAWLGDGTHCNGNFVTLDEEIVENIRNSGYTVVKSKQPMVYIIHGLVTQLKQNNLYRNKHVPELYKHSSVEQRLELLAGLLDTDGSASKSGEVVFSNTNEDIIDSVCEVVSSLGGWTTKILCRPRVNNKVTDNEKPRWVVSIRGLYNLFKLKRKNDRNVLRKISDYIPIVNIKEVKPRPVRCIKVDSESKLFLASESFIPTHNSAEKPSRLRGPQFHHAWLDELAVWNNAEDTFDMLSFGLRLGNDNRILVSTTPRNIPFYKKLLGMKNTWTLTGSTFDNKSNLSAKFIDDIVSRYQDTRLGNQELNADLLEDVEGALWSQSIIDQTRVNLSSIDELPDFLSVVIAIDPAMTANKNSDHTGICVAAYGANDHYYVLYADRHKDSPLDWAKRVMTLYDSFACDSIVVETNQGGDLVVDNLKKVPK